jgi:hypothetical protein
MRLGTLVRGGGSRVRRRGQDREHRPVPEKITSLADRVLDGEIRLPKFQREFVWSKQQVLDLLDSIARGYPIGSFLLWNSDTPTLASDQSIAGLEVPSAEAGDDTAYLLDGCQRLSTICGALHWVPDEDADSYWNLVYDLEDERFKHRDNLDAPPEREVPLRLLSDLSELVDHIASLPQPLRDRAKALYARFDKYEVSVVTLHGTSLSEIGRIFERVNTRGTPLATVEIVRAATWTIDFDLLDKIDQFRGVLAAKHYGQIDRKLLLRAIAVAAGQDFTTEGIARLVELDLAVLRKAIEQTEDAARRAVDFLTTEIGTPTAEALPYPNQFVVVVEIFRQVPRPTPAQHAEIRSWFWRMALTGYFGGWNRQQMADDLNAISRFAHGARRIEVNTPPLSTRLWTAEQYRRGTARTKALALMLATAGPRDLRSGNRVSTGESLAMANEMQFHHFFPRRWLRSQGIADEEANALANIVLLSAISNQQVADQSPAAYLTFEMDICGKEEMAQRLVTSLVSGRAFEAALGNNYAEFIAARAEMLLDLAEELSRGARLREMPPTDKPDDPVIIEHALTTEILDEDTTD